MSLCRWEFLIPLAPYQIQSCPSFKSYKANFLFYSFKQSYLLYLLTSNTFFHSLKKKKSSLADILKKYIYFLLQFVQVFVFLKLFTHMKRGQNNKKNPHLTAWCSRLISWCTQKKKSACMCSGALCKDHKGIKNKQSRSFDFFYLFLCKGMNRSLNERVQNFKKSTAQDFLPHESLIRSTFLSPPVAHILGFQMNPYRRCEMHSCS